MPTYQLKGATSAKIIGNYPSMEEVKKLRIFKNQPHLLEYVEEVPPVISKKPAKPKKPALKLSPTALLHKKELKQIDNITTKLRPILEKVRGMERQSKLLMHTQPNCGINMEATDYWVSLSLGLEYLTRANARAALRKKQILKTSKVDKKGD